MCDHCKGIRTWRKFDTPDDYMNCIAYIRQLTADDGDFELVKEESTCPLDKVKTENGWADEIRLGRRNNDTHNPMQKLWAGVHMCCQYMAWQWALRKRQEQING